MRINNQSWREIMNRANNNINYLCQPEIMTRILALLMNNAAVCSAVGSAYSAQLDNLYIDVLKVYKFYSEQITTAVAQRGPAATHFTEVKNMRAIKRECLSLVSTYISQSKSSIVINDILPPLLPYVLEDYKNGVPGARDYMVLSLLTNIVKKCKVL